MKRCLDCTYTIDCDDESVKEKSQALTASEQTPADKSRALFYFVRDRIKYNPYVPLYTLEDNRASATLKRGEGYCVQKAVLLVALSRASEIPTTLGFADIRNYILPKKIADAMRGENLFIYHGYVAFYLDGKWVKATPAFDLKMCQKNRIVPVEFDGISDAPFHRYNQDGRLHIEYVRDHGYFDDLPWEKMCEARAGRY